MPAYLIEIDVDGADDGPITYNSNFSFGGDTTTASTSAASTAVGLSQADSIFGGNGTAMPDTYLYSYTPSVDADNLQLGAGTLLNDDGDRATALTAGIATTHAVYATWPLTSNVSGGLTNFALTDSNDAVILSTSIDQNAGGDGSGHEWFLLGTFELDPSESYTLAQTTSANTFVSMRAAAVMFEAVPEPSTVVLLTLAAVGLAVGYRRR